MDFFAINQANGILPINMDALHGDLVLAATPLQQSSAVQNGDLPLPSPKYFVPLVNNSLVSAELVISPIQQTAEIQNGNLPYPPPKHLVVSSITSLTNGGLPQVPQSLDFTNGGIPLPPPQK